MKRRQAYSENQIRLITNNTSQTNNIIRSRLSLRLADSFSPWFTCLKEVWSRSSITPRTIFRLRSLISDASFWSKVFNPDINTTYGGTNATSSATDFCTSFLNSKILVTDAKVVLLNEKLRHKAG